MNVSDEIGDLSAGRLRQLFKAMAEEARLRILHLLTKRAELCVCDIMRVLDMPQSNISRHMAYLKNSGWVTDTRKGIWIHYSLSPPINCIHESLLNCVGECFGRFPLFEQDMKKLENLVEAGECAG